jgi:uncharacterized protein
LLTTGLVSLPVPEPDRNYFRAIRGGEVELAEVIAAIERAEERFVAVADTSTCF